MPGGLLPAPPTTASPKLKRKAAAPKQKQVDHDWAYIIIWYEELRRHNPGNGFGHMVISFPAILAYRDLFGIEMEPWEVDTILKLDLRWFTTLPKDADKPGRK